MEKVQLEVKRAVELWTTLYPSQERRDKRTPTDLDLICVRENIKVQRNDLWGVDSAISGFILHNPHTEDMEIWVRKSDSTLRQRFTIAHELGHFVFDRHLPIANRDNRDKRGTKPEEDRANIFAANLLMPDRRLKPYLTRFSAEDLEFSPDDVIHEVAHKFLVHEKVAAIHLKTEGYITLENWLKWIRTR